MPLASQVTQLTEASGLGNLKSLEISEHTNMPNGGCFTSAVDYELSVLNLPFDFKSTFLSFN